MNEKTVTILIDGVEVTAAEGQTILQAADAAGIYIPRLCYHKDLPPGGHCRVCTVKVNGRPTSSCTFPVSEGLVVENNTDEMNAFRRNIVEMLFVEGNHYCPACETSGDCELQALAYRLGLVAPTMPLPAAERVNLMRATRMCTSTETAASSAGGARAHRVFPTARPFSGLKDAASISGSRWTGRRVWARRGWTWPTKRRGSVRRAALP